MHTCPRIILPRRACSRELRRGSGRERERIAAKLRVETERVADAERDLADAERDFADLERGDAQAKLLLGALRDFKPVWNLMTSENGSLDARPDRRVRVNDEGGTIALVLVDFGAHVGPTEAAWARGPPSVGAAVPRTDRVVLTTTFHRMGGSRVTLSDARQSLLIAPDIQARS